MYDEYAREPKDGHVLCEGVFALALFAFESALLHLLGFHESVEAALEVDHTRHTNARPGERQAQVHEVVECEALVLAGLALQPVHELPREYVRDDGVVSIFVILPPLVALLFDRF